MCVNLGPLAETGMRITSTAGLHKFLVTRLKLIWKNIKKAESKEGKASHLKTSIKVFLWGHDKCYNIFFIELNRIPNKTNKLYLAISHKKSFYKILFFTTLNTKPLCHIAFIEVPGSVEHIHTSKSRKKSLLHGCLFTCFLYFCQNLQLWK